MPKPKISFAPLTPESWPDLLQLFGPRGACAGCWCMWWRLPRKIWKVQQGDGNKKAFRKLVQNGTVPGIIAYVDGIPAGWCAVAPREDYPGLATSRILKPVDDQPVWSIVCQFVAAPYRRQGLSVALLKAAAKHVKQQGGKIIEGYPSEPKKEQPAAFVYTGLAEAYRAAGFEEVERRSPSRPIMRRVLSRPKKTSH